MRYCSRRPRWPPSARAAAADAAQQLGADHPYSIGIRNAQARWTGEAGDPAVALDIAEAACTDARRSLGPRHPETLSARFEVAIWAGYTGDLDRAIAQWRALVADADEQGSFDLATDARRNLGYWLFVASRSAEGLETLHRVCADYHRSQAEPDVYELAARLALAHATGQLGEPTEALRLAREVAVSCAEHLGGHHEVTVTARYELARWTAESGRVEEAAGLFQTLLADLETVSHDYRGLLAECRREAARWTTCTPGPPLDPVRWWQRFANW